MPDRPIPPAAARPRRPRNASRRRGVAAILAMMFLVIFASLAAAMAVVSQGNLRVADTNLKIGRSLAAAETGMNLMVRRLEQVVNGDPNDPLDQFPGIRTTAGLIQDEALATGTAYSTGGNAYALWGGDPGEPTTADPTTTILGAMIASLRGDTHYEDDPADPDPEPRIVALGNDPFYNRPIKQLFIPSIRFGANSPTFQVTMTPHPLPADLQPSNLLYDDPYYDRLPFGDPGRPGDPGYSLAADITKREMGLDFVVGNVDPFPDFDPVIGPLDARFIRVTVTAIDDGGNATGGSSVARSISRDFRIDKTIPYAILSNARLMLGRNVSVDGNIGSRFTDAGKTNGSPVQVESDFVGLLPDLDTDLDAFFAAVGDPNVDGDGDNRLNLENSVEEAAVPGGSSGQDLDGDGFVTEFDYVLKHFDVDANETILRSEFVSEVTGASRDATTAGQLFDLLDSFGDERREGFADGELNADDLVSKISGEVSVLIDQSEWETGFAAWNEGPDAPTFKSDLQGTFSAGFGGNALNLGDEQLAVYDIDQTDFDTLVFADIARDNGDTLPSPSPLGTDVPGGFAAHDNPATPETEVPEYEGPDVSVPGETPFRSGNPYDRYFRPVYRNMVFDDLYIPLGTNPRFDNCVFTGVTYIEIEEFNDDPDFNRAGMQEPGATYAAPIPKWPDLTISVGGGPHAGTHDDTKPLGNNIHFHDCVFQGSIASGTATGTQPRSYTHVRNKVTFTGRTRFDHEAETDPEKRRFFERSSLLLPHISVEVGSFDDGFSSAENVELTGAIVAGVIDMRGQVSIRGTLISTFEPVDGLAPVEEGNTPNFNVTLGYFSQDAGDLESGAGARTAEGLGSIRIVYDPSLALPDGIDSPIEMRPLAGTYFEGSR